MKLEFHQLDKPALALVELLPESVQQQVRTGEISAQIAMKYLVPVARDSLDSRQIAPGQYYCGSGKVNGADKL
jgi:hypothetical protein